MKKMKLISLIVPVYNGEKLLGKALTSALEQSYGNIEIILINDGSTDGTGDICAAYAEKDSRIKLLQQENAGVSAARNAGLAAAQGSLIAFMDADDTLEKDYLSSMVSAMAEHGALSAACGHYYVYPDGSRVPEGACLPDGFYDGDSVKASLCVPLLADRIRENPINGYLCRYIFDAGIIRSAGIRFSGAYLEDELFLIDYFSRGSSLAVVDRPLYNYFMNPSSVTHRYLPDYPAVFRASLQQKIRLAELHGLPVPDDWMHNSTWAGLLIAAGNEFAPGNEAPLLKKVRAIKDVCSSEPFNSALENYVPRGMNRKKALVAALLRKKLYLPLGLLYAAKNRNRS